MTSCAEPCGPLSALPTRGLGGYPFPTSGNLLHWSDMKQPLFFGLILAGVAGYGCATAPAPRPPAPALATAPASAAAPNNEPDTDRPVVATVDSTVVDGLA